MIVVSKWSQLTEQSSQFEGFCFQLVQCSMKTSNIANNYCYIILSKIRSVAFWKKSIYMYGILKVFIKVNCVHVCTQVVSDTWTSTVHMYEPCPQATPRFISQPWRKIGRRPRIKTTSWTGNGGLSQYVTWTQFVLPSPPFPVHDVVLILGLPRFFSTTAR